MYSYDFSSDEKTEMPLFPQAIALILLSFNISAKRFTVDVLPLVPVIQMNFDCDKF